MFKTDYRYNLEHHFRNRYQIVNPSDEKLLELYEQFSALKKNDTEYEQYLLKYAY